MGNSGPHLEEEAEEEEDDDDMGKGDKSPTRPPSRSGSELEPGSPEHPASPGHDGNYFKNFLSNETCSISLGF